MRKTHYLKSNKKDAEKKIVSPPHACCNFQVYGRVSHVETSTGGKQKEN